MAPHAEETNGVASYGNTVPVNEGQAPLEPGIKKNIAQGKMLEFPRPPKFDDPYKERDYLKGRLAAAFRIFGKYGFDEGVAGHITLRDPVDPHCFWVNPFGVAFSLINKSDLILVNHSGQVIDGGDCRLLNTAAYMIHSAIHKARPDVICAAHSHSIYGRTWCSLGRKIDTLTQDACAFHNDHVVYDSFNGVVLAEKEGKDIAACLGDKKAALLQNHGLLTTGQTVEEAVFWFVSLEKCCHSQLMAEAAAASNGEKPVAIGEEEAQYTYRTVGTARSGWFSAKPLFDVIHKETNGDYLQ
ncbi:Decarboxylase NovR [Fulvia fulva]|uniref:Decarboxylase NovR n=1 Tax=Passalora fulva TaxID=5499 RepID=A0A9Q8LEP4_PASFU|nr:Decarboxylase NovR [Fulvia fulva]KAK4626491.1 Decarboxylase NovR [Fulvia fulva]KAK4627419.1 Decarboxylase NovR [Fulvia fulva]UJO15849.1 Decarboxylase NovR [Fulvia fulva]WPV14356.1 Decarboxylase NovR [Fulvia fulva]WPV28393.1 Decarboxylase NovR [Fulvia fulva]